MNSPLGAYFLPLTFLFETLSRFPVLLSLSAVYVVLCMMARRFAPKFISPLASRLASLHILALAGLSGLIAYIIVQELSGIIRPATLFSVLCDPEAKLWESGALGLIQNLNMMLKIVEMHHTFWMSMSGRQDHITPFQLFHNVIMLWIAWAQIGPSGSSVQWLPILLNCVVHVFMYLCMYQVYRGGRTPFYATLPMLQFIQGVLTSFAIIAVFVARFVHDYIDPDQFRDWRCSGKWSSFLMAASLALCYPLGYMTLHKPATDSWLAERGLGLFFSIGHYLRHAKEEKRE